MELYNNAGREKELSESLLAKFLTPKQKKQYITEERITVVGKSGQTYTIPPFAGMATSNSDFRNMISVGDTGTYYWCVGLPGLTGLPLMVGLKLLLEESDYNVRSMANRYYR